MKKKKGGIADTNGRVFAASNIARCFGAICYKAVLCCPPCQSPPFPHPFPFKIGQGGAAHGLLVKNNLVSSLLFSQKAIGYHNSGERKGQVSPAFMDAKGGEKMKPHSHEEHIRHTFDAFCQKVLRNEARDHLNELAQKQNRVRDQIFNLITIY